MRSTWWTFGWLLILGGVLSQPLGAVTYEVGPGRAREAIGDVRRGRQRASSRLSRPYPRRSQP